MLTTVITPKRARSWLDPQDGDNADANHHGCSSPPSTCPRFVSTPNKRRRPGASSMLMGSPTHHLRSPSAAHSSPLPSALGKRSRDSMMTLVCRGGGDGGGGPSSACSVVSMADGGGGSTADDCASCANGRVSGGFVPRKKTVKDSRQSGFPGGDKEEDSPFVINRALHDRDSSRVDRLIRPAIMSKSNVNEHGEPLFTAGEVKLIVERAVNQKEAELIELYDKVLQEKLQEQFQTFTTFNQEYISSDLKSSDFSYLC